MKSKINFLSWDNHHEIKSSLTDQQTCMNQQSGKYYALLGTACRKGNFNMMWNKEKKNNRKSFQYDLYYCPIIWRTLPWAINPNVEENKQRLFPTSTVHHISFKHYNHVISYSISSTCIYLLDCTGFHSGRMSSSNLRMIFWTSMVMTSATVLPRASNNIIHQTLTAIL